MSTKNLKKYKEKPAKNHSVKDQQLNSQTTAEVKNQTPKSTESKTKAQNRDKTKKIIIITLIVCVLFSVLYFTMPLIKKLFEKEPEKPIESYQFYPIDYNENIYDDEIYMSLDRNFYFEDPSYGTTISFDPDTLSDIPSEYEQPVGLLVTYIQAATAGNKDKINSMFSDKYYDDGFEDKTSFTAQKIYETKFSIIETDSISEDGQTWTRWSFWVEYKIRRNNGTFRNDMESDCTRKELFVITYRDGHLEIDGVTPYRVS